MRLAPVSLVFMALTLVPGSTKAQGEWELEHEDDVVKVYVRPESNGDMSVRVETTARATARQVQTILDDAPAYPEWVHRCEEAYALPGGSANNYVYYSHIGLPFPFQDKEVVARIKQSWSGGTYTRTIKSEPGALPATSGRDRLATYDAEWKVNPLANGLVSIVCTCRTAAGAGLPNWVRKEIMTGGPAKTMHNLVDRLQR